MSLVAHYGFDNFDAIPWNGIANPNWPKIGAGLVGTPYEADLVVTLGTNNEASNRYNTVGVTGLDIHKVGAGAERRNLLLACRDGVTATAYSTTVRLSAQRNITAATSYRRTTGFNFIDLSPAESNTSYNLLMHRRGTSTSGLIVRRAGNQWSLGNMAFPVERNRQYYIEVVEYMTGVASGTGTIWAEIWVDGTLMQPAYGYATLPFGSIYASNLEISAGAAGMSAQVALGISDIYVTDELGEAPYNGRMGPQIVLPFAVTGAQVPAWEVVGAADAVTALSDNLDTTSIRAPIGKAEATVDFDLKLGPGSVVNAVAVFGRAKRDSGAPRTIAGALTRADGVSMGGSAALPLTDTYSARLLGALYPANAADSEKLIFPDSGKLRLVITSE